MMEEPLQHILAQALMPSVMISASAVILQGIWAEQRSLGERMRNVSHRLRDPSNSTVDETRRVRQLILLRRRLRLSGSALTAIYSALACLLFITLAIAVRGMRVPQEALRVVFVIAVALMFIAVTFILVELRLANRSLDAELEDHEALLARHS